MVRGRPLAAVHVIIMAAAQFIAAAAFAQDTASQKIDGDDKAELLEVVGKYRHGQIPLIVPITLLKHHLRRHPDPYITRQFYLKPHPEELMLRNSL